jgi:quinol monooxygenase YgiN
MGERTMGIETEVVLIAEATALPGKREELRRAFNELVPKSLAEEGVSVFRLHENRDKPGHFVLYERFRDQVALDTHVTLDPFREDPAGFRLVGGGGQAEDHLLPHPDGIVPGSRPSTGPHRTGETARLT